MIHVDGFCILLKRKLMIGSKKGEDFEIFTKKSDLSPIENERL